MGTAVIMRVNSAPILESAKHDFYFVPLFIKLFVIGHRSFPTISARNTRRDSFTGKAFATSRHHSLYPPRVPWPMAEKQDRGALVITCRVILLNKLRKNLVKDAQSAPEDKAIVGSFVWPILTWGIFPLQAVLDDIDNPMTIRLSSTL